MNHGHLISDSHFHVKGSEFVDSGKIEFGYHCANVHEIVHLYLFPRVLLIKTCIVMAQSSTIDYCQQEISQITQHTKMIALKRGTYRVEFMLSLINSVCIPKSNRNNNVIMRFIINKVYFHWIMLNKKLKG